MPKIAKYISIYLLGLCMVHVIACDSDQTTEDIEGLLVTIAHSSGDDCLQSGTVAQRYYAPYPFNQAELPQEDGSHREVMIISRKIDVGKQVGVIPFAKMTTLHLDGSESVILIAKPTNKKYELEPIDDFYDFGIEQFYLKQMVQYWYLNRNGLNGTIIKEWKALDQEEYKEQ